MKCRVCGAVNDITASHCRYCGNPLGMPHAHKKSFFSPLKVILIILLICAIAVGASLVYVVYFDTSTVEIMELNSNSANVLENSEIASNIPNSNISRAICNYTNNCTPVYKIGDGSSPVTVISAGVHGDQLVPSVAAMRLINYFRGLDYLSFRKSL